jgi:hypothetical protein
VVVHASTRQFYGRVQKLPVDENQPVAPPDANGVSKFAGEQYWLLEHRVRGRPVVSLRLTNCYGPRLRIRDARQTFLGIWIRCVLEGRPFEVWGGSQLRDLTYVDDVTEAFLLAADRTECHGRIFNIGGPPRPRCTRSPSWWYGWRGQLPAMSPGSSRRTAQASTSAAIMPTTLPSARRPGGSQRLGSRMASGGRSSGSALGWRITCRAEKRSAIRRPWRIACACPPYVSPRRLP